MFKLDILGELASIGARLKSVKGSISALNDDFSSIQEYDRYVKGIAHRGLSSIAPENTLPAFRLARRMGFLYVECDILFTSDGVPMLLHDSTINRTSNGTGALSSLTYEQVRAYDFGSWKSPDYAGTVIPTFEEFIALCKNIGLSPYIELKTDASYTVARINGLVDTVKAYGMEKNVTWIAVNKNYLGYVAARDASARLGYIVTSVDASNIETAQTLLNGSNNVFLFSSAYSDAVCGLCLNAGLPLEAWVIDDANTIKSMNGYITGVASNSINAGEVLYEANISNT